MFNILDADIIVMQELKIQRKDLRDDMVMLEGWDCYFSLPKHKKGYSGVGIYTRNAVCAPIRAEEGVLGVLPSCVKGGQAYCDLPVAESIGGYLDAEQMESALGSVDPAALDAEGRCLVLEFPAFVLFGVYAPANSNGLRDDFRHAFHAALDMRIRNLVKLRKSVVLVGDLNVSRDELDTASAAEDSRKAGISHEEFISAPNRRIFNQLLFGGEVIGDRDPGRETPVLWDTTRAFHEGRKGMYTHWEQKINARPGNFGSRIDFILVSERLKDWVKAADIQEGLLGSDHCPVFVDFDNTVTMYHNEQMSQYYKSGLADVMNPPGMFECHVRKREYKATDALAFSAKRLPEFDKRRSIKSMFAAPALKKKESVPSLPAEDGSAVGGLTLAKQVVSDGPGSLLKQQNSLEIDGRKLSDEDIQALQKFGAHDNTAPTPSSSLKRKASSTSAAAKKESPMKRQKSDAASGKAQQSLKGFFQAQRKDVDASAVASKADTPAYEQEFAVNGTLPQTPTGNSPNPTPDTTATRSLSLSPGISPSSIASTLAQNETSQRSWGALFSKPVAPLCEGHTEPCKTMQTKKKGSNQGRSFWMCARPLGPSGAKETATEWRCATFIWSSDWGGGRKKEEDEKGRAGAGLGM